MTHKKTLFSGLQPSGNLHIGNYLGALENWLTLQNSGKYNPFFCIVDYHTLTGNMTAEERRDQILTTAIEYLALGIDPEKATLFVQSHVPEHTELAWIFSTVTPMAELERMTQYKDKASVQRKNVNAGLFTYPVLQAADILLYHATEVPVGEDQVQHIELARLVARQFNKRYKQTFKEPHAFLTNTPRVKSLIAPDKKMSKSLGLGHVIELADEPNVIDKKLRKAVTATEGGKKSPGVENLLLLLEHFGDKKLHKQYVAAQKDGSIRYGDLKKDLAVALGDSFAEFREKRKELEVKRENIAEILLDGAQKAKAIAEETMTAVREIVGVR